MSGPATNFGAVTLTGYLQENNLVFVKLPRNNYSISGIFHCVADYKGEAMMFDLDKIGEISIVINQTSIQYYQNIETSETMSCVEYTKQLILLDKRVEDDDEDDPSVWANITDRHAYELFVALWKPSRVNTTVLQPVVISVQGEPPKTGNSFINPVRKITGDLTNTLYFYTQGDHVISVVKEFLVSKGFTLTTNEREMVASGKGFFLKDGSLQFSKMFTPQFGEKYITIEIPALKTYEKGFGVKTGTYDEVFTKFNETEQTLREILNAYFNRHLAVSDLPDLTVGTIMTELQCILTNIREIESMKKTQRAYNSAWKNVNNLINLIRAATNKVSEK